MGEPRTISKGAYFTTLIAAYTGVIGVELVWGHWFLRRLGFASDAFVGIAPGLNLFSLLLTNLLLDRGLRAFGLSRSGRVVEVRRPSAIALIAPDEETFAIRLSAREANGFGLVLLGFLGLLVLLGFLAGRDGKPMPPYLIGTIGLCGTLAAMSFAMQFATILQVGPEGIVACRGPLHLRGTFVPWSEVADCRVVTVRDPIGRVTFIRPRLEDASGRDLFPGLADSLFFASRTDRERLLGILKRRFPKIDSDPWEM